jgi:NAD(P)-dependent dehydrogenase (short-subunit alcohol dehydrogenase family)
VISCSRHPFPEDCPWEAGPEDHVQVDLGDPDNTIRAIAEMKDRLRAHGGRLNALVNNAAISPKGERGSRLSTIETRVEDWKAVF